MFFAIYFRSFFSAQAFSGASAGDAGQITSNEIESRLSERLSQLYISTLGQVVRVQVLKQQCYSCSKYSSSRSERRRTASYFAEAHETPLIFCCKRRVQPRCSDLDALTPRVLPFLAAQERGVVRRPAAHEPPRDRRRDSQSRIQGRHRQARAAPSTAAQISVQPPCKLKRNQQRKERNNVARAEPCSRSLARPPVFLAMLLPPPPCAHTHTAKYLIRNSSLLPLPRECGGGRARASEIEIGPD